MGWGGTETAILTPLEKALLPAILELKNADNFGEKSVAVSKAVIADVQFRYESARKSYQQDMALLGMDTEISGEAFDFSVGYLTGEVVLGSVGKVVNGVGKGTSKTVPEYGKKLEYVFGNATGNKHNIDRSIAMEKQLNSIGVFDNANGRKLVLDNLTEAFNNPSSILKVQDNGRVVRESLLSGPNGLVKVESVWEGEKLITVQLFGGK